jgi:hypothetical protein
VLYNRQYNYYIKVIFMYFLLENPLLGLHNSESYQVFLVVVQLYENAPTFAGTITDICFPTVTPMTNMQVTSLNRMSSFFYPKSCCWLACSMCKLLNLLSNFGVNCVIYSSSSCATLRWTSLTVSLRDCTLAAF